MSIKETTPELRPFDATGLTVLELPIAQLKPYKRNARTHSRKQVRQIAESIREFGFTNPILIDQGDTILAGHGRIEAAKLLGLSIVPALRIEHMSETQKRAYVLADNKLALNAGWDGEILAQELSELRIEARASILG
jgi:ParB-like chromosome segregation protein Spo0J